MTGWLIKTNKWNYYFVLCGVWSKDIFRYSSRTFGKICR